MEVPACAPRDVALSFTRESPERYLPSLDRQYLSDAPLIALASPTLSACSSVSRSRQRHGAESPEPCEAPPDRSPLDITGPGSREDSAQGRSRASGAGLFLQSVECLQRPVSPTALHVTDALRRLTWACGAREERAAVRSARASFAADFAVFCCRTSPLKHSLESLTSFQSAPASVDAPEPRPGPDELDGQTCGSLPQLQTTRPLPRDPSPCEGVRDLSFPVLAAHSGVAVEPCLHPLSTNAWRQLWGQNRPAAAAKAATPVTSVAPSQWHSAIRNAPRTITPLRRPQTRFVSFPECVSPEVKREGTHIAMHAVTRHSAAAVSTHPM
ncbi:hypothetical protein STCU_10131 [Strigomonas culicis]|uniref:Uncharacterized protein n=1 Tax=Strigomonas culicis TaxID=28005 RepID=S9V5M3_9TRYP|nr:hypothetical protein STCU_10131 [Strigomonas culicis]|eukprot:EPY18185.1 hypothetical protein STCU_10131 [Strigomonas culicis]